ncbi:MAG: TIGR03790 family protein, partial [Opitutales bacterium]|nr:TIGR03790 family protein [Opitutales bacterium]
PGAKKNGFATDAASVDSELAASLMNVKKLAGTAANPLYKNFENPDLHKVYGVLRAARLDGANLSQMKALVDSALLAERAGVRGRAYIDKNKRGGGYKSGNEWIAAAGETLSRMHFDTTVDEADALMGYGTRFDAPAFYFGWYSASPQAYFCGPNFRAAAGAVGLHIYSFSASDLRKSGWANALVKAGFAQTCGNVYEPYLAGTHEPSSMMKAYEAGFCAGEAAYASARFLSWQWVVLGDPLYKPFAVSLEKQLERIDAGQIDGLSQYSVLREMNRRRAAGESPAKLADFAEKYIGKIPDAALVWRLVSEREAAGESGAALERALDLYSRAVWESAEFAGLSMELAGYLQKRGKSREAMGVYEGAAKTARGALLKFAVRRAEGLSKASGVQLSEKFVSLKKKFDAEDAAAREKAAREKAEREKKAAEKEAAARKK